MKELVGRRYGPFPLSMSRTAVDLFVEATGDDPSRWNQYAPPSYASAALFTAAPAFLEDEEVARFARLLIHGEQSFTWVAPMELDVQLAVTGEVTRVRSRGDTHFVVFGLEARGPSSILHLQAESTFIMSDSEPPAGGADEESEPPPLEGSSLEPPPGPVNSGSVPPLVRSASRLDLVRYAAATRDWNPVHWDHDVAVAAGFPRVVCHGLLMSAWMNQAAARYRPGIHPFGRATYRFRAPLPAAVVVDVRGERKGDDMLVLSVDGDGVEYATAKVELEA